MAGLRKKRRSKLRKFIHHTGQLRMVGRINVAHEDAKDDGIWEAHRLINEWARRGE